MKTFTVAILFVLWMLITLALAISFVGLVVIMCDDTWINFGKTLIDKI